MMNDRGMSWRGIPSEEERRAEDRAMLPAPRKARWSPTTHPKDWYARCGSRSRNGRLRLVLVLEQRCLLNGCNVNVKIVSDSLARFYLSAVKEKKTSFDGTQRTFPFPRIPTLRNSLLLVSEVMLVPKVMFEPTSFSGRSHNLLLLLLLFFSELCSSAVLSM